MTKRKEKGKCEWRTAVSAVNGLARSVLTLVITPPHEKLHVEAELAAEATEQPLMPAVEGTLPNVRERLAGYRDTPRGLGAVAMLNLSAALIQFTDHSGIGPDDIVGAPSFTQTEALRMEHERRYTNSGPLDAVRLASFIGMPSFRQQCGSPDVLEWYGFDAWRRTSS